MLVLPNGGVQQLLSFSLLLLSLANKIAEAQIPLDLGNDGEHQLM